MLQISTEVLQEQCLDHQHRNFQPTPLATGIGGGLSAANMLGMGNQGITPQHESEGSLVYPLRNYV